MPVAAASQRQAPIASIDHWGAPTNGWNSLNNVTDMQPTDAIRLDNFVADLTNVRLRHGCTSHVQTPLTAPIRSLMVYNGATTSKLLAAGGGSTCTIYDVSAPGTATSVASGFTSDIWESANFATPGGQFLVAVNGTTVQYTYDGTTWTLRTNTWGTTGSAVTPTNFSSVVAYQSRLYFAAPSSLLLYYLPQLVLFGEVHALDVGSYCPKGGVITMLGTWTRDNGFGGADDVLVVVTSKGEAVLFSGIDPDTASGWSMIGRFEIGEPVAGHRALANLGPDMLLICEDGFQPLSRYLALGQSQALTMANPSVMGVTAISRKIGNAVTQAVKSAKSLFGWQAILYPANNVMIINVPVAGAPFQQYVVNTINGAWSRFLGLNAYCWAIYLGGIYFGGEAGLVVHADNGSDDMGTAISFDLVTSFQLLGRNAQQKRATMCRPYLTANGSCAPRMDVNVDYNISAITASLATGFTDTEWDAFDWDAAPWASSALVQNNWYSVDGIGNAFAVRLSGQAKTTSLVLLAFDIAFESGVGFV